jgi:alpha-methylacyl-CoA racemase
VPATRCRAPDILSPLKVIDLSALGPGPFASMMLADHGAQVLSLPRPSKAKFDPASSLARGKQVLPLDLRAPGATDLVASLAKTADVLMESARPGVMERLGLGPDVLMATNPRLIYVRLTGWGQDGPYAQRAGHDINFLAVAGALGVTGLNTPIAPPALLGDIACGSFTAVIGVLLALHERTRTSRGSLVDASIVDGAVYTLSAMFGELGAGMFSGRLGEHLLSGAVPFYGTYRCADGGWFSVGAIEPQFYAGFLTALGFEDIDPSRAAQWSSIEWPALRDRVAEHFATHPRAHWTARFAAIEGCGAPVLGLAELPDDPHLKARGTVIRTPEGGLQAAPAPRVDRSGKPVPPGRSAWSSVPEALGGFGLSDEELNKLRSNGLLPALVPADP